MQNRVFDTKVQDLKYRVLREVAAHAFEDRLQDIYKDIPKTIVPGPKPSMRCCIYKEREIVNQRIHLALGGDKSNPNVIEVIELACDECPASGYEVTDSCRGCIAHRCEEACRKNAITFDEHQKAHIDKSKCVNCGMCAKVCPYTAITKRTRPCENACKINAISQGESGAAQIDNSKCISCGACVYQCPFGAIVDKSFILDVIDLLKKSENNQKYKVYAVIAPAIYSQFTYAKLGQVVTGINELGFFTTIEAALGADMVSYNESAELAEKGFLTTSCCPAFVSYVQKSFPQMAEHISHNPSPMAAIANFIKTTDPGSKIVFIGPCTAKKMEVQKPEVRDCVDAAITFEELQALFDGKGVDITTLEETPLNNASYYGRIFARSGGVTDAVTQAIKEQNLDPDGTLTFKPVTCNGIEECRMALMKASKNVLPGNFIEGMACVGGCIGGAGVLTHGEKNKATVDKYGMEAYEKSIGDALSVIGIFSEHAAAQNECAAAQNQQSED